MSGVILLILRMLLTISLYAFLGWALLTLWNGLHRQSILLAARRIPKIYLTLQSPDNVPDVRHFKQADIVIGRDQGCEVTLHDETVSSRHAQLSFHHGQWWLEDLGSKNGTILNQERLITPTVVVTGDEIGCGQTKLIFTLDSNTQQPPSEENKFSE